ncbi:MAG: extracellular solute-binding protein family 1 [Paenibacillaceae bacterium]|jgi:multiple sugar transport system substrate-binding protein|nr:extracellular solute-binding protein family 1 [Paenibacillaceae bacterium]
MKLARGLSHTLLFVFLSVCTACNGGSYDNTRQENGFGTPTNTGENTTNQEQSYENDSAELVIYGNPGDSEEVWNDRIGDALKKAFPNYKFTYIQKSKKNTLDSMIVTGEQLDLIYDSVSGAVNSMMSTGLKFDMSDLAKKHKVDLSRFDPATIGVVKQFGGLYGLPIHNGGLVLYFNKDIFDKFGVGYPQDGMTWDEAIELGKKMTRFVDGVQYLGLVNSISHVLSLNSYSLPYVDSTTGKTAINNDNYRKLVETLGIAPSQTAGYKEALAKKKRTFNANDFRDDLNIAMFVMNFGLQDSITKFNWDMVSLPVFKDRPGIGTQPYPNILFMSNISKHKDQAMEVLKYLTSDEYQMILSKKGYVPVVNNDQIKKAFMKDSAFANKNMVNAMFKNQFASPIRRTEFDGLVSGPLLQNITKVILGETDLNTALRTVEETANNAIAQKK